jgi:serine/threonine protein kinase
MKILIGIRGWRTGELVKPMGIPSNFVGNQLYLADFGLSIRPGIPLINKWHAPVQYCAPEQFHGVDPSYASDMWSFMCVFVQLYTSCHPFESRHCKSQINLIVRALGPLPAHWKGYYHAPGIGEDGWYGPSSFPYPEKTMAALIRRQRPEVGDIELELVLSIISKVFCYEPEGRFSALQLLEDESLTKLMEIYGCQ